MTLKSVLGKLPQPVRRRPVLSAVVALMLVVLLVVILTPRSRGDADTSYHVVKRGDFVVSIVEGGTLAAVSEVSIRSDIEGTARIITIVPEGSYVKKGDVLVELDASQAQDQVNQQRIAFEKARFAVEQAKAQIEILKSSTNSDFLAADLKLKLAKISLDKYERGQRMVNFVEASNTVVAAAAKFAVDLDTYNNSTNLAAKGYETKSKADGDRLAVLNTANNLLVASNKLWMLQTFDVVKDLATLQADVQQAEQELERVISQNARKMAQYEADLVAQENTLALNKQKLERDERNLKATTILAPQDGLVVYQVSENRFSSESLVEGGAVVRNRQELIKLPDLSRMKVTIKVHESHVNMVRPGLPAMVMLDSAPEIRYRGVVERVAPLPDTQARWGNPNLKVYNTDVHLVDAIPNVKPGVSAKAEVIVTNIENTLAVPIQAITTLKGKQVAYVLRGGTPEPAAVELGLYNTKFIEVAKGLQEGDRVLLSPPFDTQDRELDGSVLSPEEKAKFAPTNRPSATPQPTLPAGPSGGPGQPIASVDTANPVAASMERAAATGEGRRKGGFNPEAMMKEFDKDGDGQLSDAERDAMRTTLAARFAGMGGPPGGGTNGGAPRFNREEMLKQFDKNNDGTLDDEERAAMRERFPGARGGRGGRPGGAEGRPEGSTDSPNNS